MSVLKKSKISGFSLLELVTVLLIITVLSTIAIRSTVDIGYATRYEKTRDMADKIKKAIAGHSGRLVNGQPDISGYVADIGRAPEYLRDLLQAGFCRTTGNIYVNQPSDSLCIGTDVWDWAVNTNCLQRSDTAVDTGLTTKAACTPDATYVWIGVDFDIDTDLSTAVCDPIGTGSCTNLKYGWNGPYLQTSDAATDGTALSDGWANESTDNNYGWKVYRAEADLKFSIESFGKDQSDDGDINGSGASDDALDDNLCYTSGGADGYSEDCVTSIIKSEYNKTVGMIPVKINTDQTTLSPYIDPTEIGFCTDTDNTLFTQATCDSVTDRDWDVITSKCLVTSDSTAEPDCNTSVLRWNSTLGVCTQVLNTETQDNCINVSLHNWDVLVTPSSPPAYPDVNLCMRIYYRIDGVVTSLISTNFQTLTRNGNQQGVIFEFDNNTSTLAIDDQLIPNGINAIGIYEDSRSCSDTTYTSQTTCEVASETWTVAGCSNNEYPDKHPIQYVTFAPYKTIDNLVW